MAHQSVDYWLEGISGVADRERFPLIRDDPQVFGRDRDCQIRLGDPRVSRRHAEIQWTDKGFQLKDLNSSNGTYHNGSRIQQVMLQTGDEIKVGESRFTFHGPPTQAGLMDKGRIQCEHCGRWLGSAEKICPGCGAPAP